MSIVRKCYLNPLVIGREQIQLQHEEIAVIDCNELFPDVTEIAELRLYAMANCNTGCVVIQSMGTVPCRHKGRVLTRGAKYLFGPGNIIQLNGVMWEYEYEVCFNPPMPEYVLQLDLPRLFEKTAIEPQYLINYANSNWQNFDNEKLLVYTPNLLNYSAGVAAFSWDDVLVKRDTWILRFDNVEKRLKKLYNKKYKIAIFISQSTKKRETINVFQKRIEKFMIQLEIPIQVFISLGDTKYKKPIPYMWQTMMDNFNGKLIIEPDRCCFVGSSSDPADRLFAVNVEIRYFTAEEYFKHRSVSSPEISEFNPKLQNPEIVFSFVVSAVQEIAVMVGRPCSGKTFFCQSYLCNYHYFYIVGPTQYTTKNTIARLRKFLSTNKTSVVLNGMNFTKAIRKKCTQLAKDFNIPCRCFVMDVSRGQARHINKIRELSGLQERKKFDEQLDAFDAMYEPPDISEGFTKIIYVPFVPHYKTVAQKKLYRYFLLAD